MMASGVSSNAAISALLASERAAAFAVSKNRGNEVAPVKEVLSRYSGEDDPRRVPVQIKGNGTRASLEDERRTRRGNTTDNGTLGRADADETGKSQETPSAAVTASTLFLVQLLGQDEVRSAPGPGLPGLAGDISNRSDAAALGSQFYRQAGGEPALLTEQATFLKIAV